MAMLGRDPASRLARRRDAVLWLVSRDVDEMIYGAVVSGGVLAVVASHSSAAWQALAATSVTLLVYWTAHVYAQTLADALADPEPSWGRRIGRAAVEELSILRGGGPALVAFGVASLLGAGTSTATDVAVWTRIALLAGVGYLAGRSAGSGVWGTVLAVLAAATLGVVVAILKAALH